MKKLIIATQILLASSIAQSEPLWVKVVQNEFESIYYDKNSLNMHGPLALVDVLINRHKPSHEMPTVSFLSSEEYDCIHHESATTRIVTTTEHYGKGKVVRDSSVESRWRGSGTQEIDEGDKFFYLMKAVCRDNSYQANTQTTGWNYEK
ncbi:MAG: hypothetical protein EBY22_10625 [Gammaproteobacteria bacterium]|nr:hypothetical protein [Gammaproteobacteria bacterium]